MDCQDCRPELSVCVRLTSRALYRYKMPLVRSLRFRRIIIFLRCASSQVDRSLAVSFKPCIGLSEMFASETASVGRLWRGVGSWEYKMFTAVYKCTFLYSIATPKHEYKAFTLFSQSANSGICEFLPSPSLM